MKTQKSLIAILTSVMFAIFTLAFVARAQFPAPAGSSTTTSVVIPSVLPDSLPIGSEQIMLDWAVTNRQWMQNGNPLDTGVSIEIIPKDKDGNDMESAGSSGIDIKYSSYDDFMNRMADSGMRAVYSLKKNKVVDQTRPVKILITLDHGNWETGNGLVAILIKGGPILLSEITRDTFLDLKPTFFRSVVRITNLEKFEISVDSDPQYSYVWPTNASKPASAVLPSEYNTKEFVSLNPWYSTNAFKARFKITAGETATYTQTGSKLKAPSVKVLSDRVVEVSMTPGSHTVVETSVDMVNWSVMKDIPWNLSTESQTVLVYPPNSPHRFFRAWSE